MESGTEWIKEAVTVTRMTRRRLAGALLAAAIPALVVALAGCEAGLDAPTLSFHPAANGAAASAAGVSINDAFVLGPTPGHSLPAGGRAGLFLTVNSASGDQLQSISAPGVAGSVKLSGGPVSLSPYVPVNLTGPLPRIVLTNLSAPLTAGQTITLLFDFASAGVVPVQVPVEPHAFEYATYAQPPKPSPTPKPKPSATATGKAHPAPSASAGKPATPTPTASPTK